jgi:hypothetical protein
MSAIPPVAQNNAGQMVDAQPSYDAGKTYPLVKAYTGSTTSPITPNILNGAYVLSYSASNWGTRQAVLEALDPDGATWITVATLTANGSQGAIVGEGASLRVRFAGTGNITGFNANLAKTAAAPAGSIFIPGQAPTAQALGVFGSPVTTAQAGANYDGFQIVGTGGSGQFAYSVFAGLVPGVTIDVNTGLYSGLPTTPGDYAGIILQVRDKITGAIQKLPAFTLKVAAASSTLSITSTPAPATTVVQGRVLPTGDLEAFGGTGGPYTYDVASGTPPAGFAVNAISGLFGGSIITAPPGAYNGIVLRASDGVNTPALLAAFNITVTAALSMTPTVVTSATQGSAYAGSSFAAAGGSGGYTWSLAPDSAALPPGITRSTNTLGGTPTTAGSYPGIKMRATDSAGFFIDSAPFTIDVAAAAGTIGGYSINDVGAGLYAGFQFDFGTDFSAAPPRWHPNEAPNAAWKTGPIHVPWMGLDPSGGWSMGMDQYWRGARSQSPTAFGLDTITANGGGNGCNFNIREPDSVLLPTLPTTFSLCPGGKPSLLAGMIYSAPGYVLSAKGDFIVECKFQSPAGSLVGYWSSFLWTSAQFWPDGGELDVPEIFKGQPADTPTRTLGQTFIRVNSIINGVDGGGAGSETPYFLDIRDDRPYWFMAKKTATKIEFYDDFDVQGVLAKRGEAVNNIGRFKGAHDLRLGAGAGPYGQSGMSARAFNAIEWPSDTKLLMVRSWSPQGSPRNLATVDLGTVAAVAGTPITPWVLPGTVWNGGSVPDVVEVVGGFYGYDSPGALTRNATTKLPGGMTYNAATKTVSWTPPATEGGTVCVYFLGSFNAGGAGRRARLTFKVAPVKQASFPSVIGVNANGSLNQTVAYTDFHSGDLTHTYTSVASDQSWAVVTMGAGNRSFTIAGTAPNLTQTVNVTGFATNAAGQSTPFAIAINVSTIWTPLSWSNLKHWWDFTDTTKVFSDTAGATPAVPTSGTQTIALVKDKMGAADLSNAVSASRPVYKLVGGVPMGGFTKATPTHLDAVSSVFQTELGGVNKPFTMVLAMTRGAPGVSSRPIAIGQTGSGSPIQVFFAANDGVGVSRTGGANISSPAAGFTVDEPHVVTIVFDGTTVSLFKDGYFLASGNGASSTSQTLGQLTLGAIKNSATTWDSVFGFSGAIAQVMVSSDAVRSQDVRNAERMMIDAVGTVSYLLQEKFATLDLYSPTNHGGFWRPAPTFNTSDGVWGLPASRSLPWEWQLYSTQDKQGYQPLSIVPGEGLRITVGALTGTNTYFQGAYPNDLGSGLPPPVVANGALFTRGSGMINSLPSFAQKYGTFEAEISMPAVYQPGGHPAFWLYDQATSKEIDIVEILTDNDRRLEFHTPGYLVSGAEPPSITGASIVDMPVGWDKTEFHTYSLVWTATTVEWFVDGVSMRKIANNGYLNVPMVVILNYALRSHWNDEYATPPHAPDASVIGSFLRCRQIRVIAPPVASLSGLTVSPATFTQGDAEGTVIGTIGGKTAGSTLSVPTGETRYKISSDQTQVLVGPGAATAGNFSGPIVETLVGSPNSPRTTTVTFTVTPSAVLPTFAIQAETQAVVTAYAAANGGTAPSTAIQWHMDRLVRRLKAAGVYADFAAGKPAGFWECKFAVNKAQSKINWINPTGAVLTEYGTVTFTAGTGWSGFSSVIYLGTGFNLSQIDPNSAFMGVYSNTTGATAVNVDCGAQDVSANGLQIVCCDTAVQMRTRMMGAIVTAPSVGYFNGQGWCAVSRTTSATFMASHRGPVVDGAVSSVSAAITSAVEIGIGHAPGNSTGSARSLSCFLLCAGKTRALTEEIGAAIEDIHGPQTSGRPNVFEPGYQPATVTADIVVYGLTMPAVIAAYAAKRKNPALSVVIVGDEGQTHLWRLGGLLAQGLDLMDINYAKATGNVYVSGIFKDMITWINANKYGNRTNFDPTVQNASDQQTAVDAESRHWNAIARRMLDPTKTTGAMPGKDIPIYLSGGMNAVTKTGTKVTSFTTADGRTFNCGFLIGADYIGTALPLLSIPYRTGMDAAGTGSEATAGYRLPSVLPKYGSPSAGVAGTTSVTVDPYVTPGVSASGLIANVVAAPALTVGAADPAVQPMTIRTPMTTAKTRWAPTVRDVPPNYSAANYEFTARAYAAAAALGTTPTIMDVMSFGQIYTDALGNYYDCNNSPSGLSSDMPQSGLALSAAGGNLTQRTQVFANVHNFVLGLIYWHANSGDSRIPAAVATAMASTYSLDALQMTEVEPGTGRLWFPDQNYVRQPVYQMKNAGFMFDANDSNMADGSAPRSLKTIGCHSYPADSHLLRVCAYDDSTGAGVRIMLQGGIGGSSGGTNQIIPEPLEAFVPDAAVCTNYATPTHPSFSARAWSSYRMEPAMGVAAESLGIIAAMSVTNNVAPLALTYGDTSTAGTIAYELTNAGDVTPIYLRSTN